MNKKRHKKKPDIFVFLVISARKCKRFDLNLISTRNLLSWVPRDFGDFKSHQLQNQDSDNDGGFAEANRKPG